MSSQSSVAGDAPSAAAAPPPAADQSDAVPTAAAVTAAPPSGVGLTSACFPFHDVAKAPRLTVVDIGAGSYEGCSGDLHEPLARQGLCDVVGFEADAEECAKVNARPPAASGARIRCFPYVLFDGSPVSFRNCVYGATSSVFEPNVALISKYQQLPAAMAVVSRSEPRPSTTLDSVWQEISESLRTGDCSAPAAPDFVKLDVQGAELAVLKGAERCLAGTVVVEVEVEFVPLYQDQPLFGDVDRCLRQFGFEFHRFSSLQGRTMRPVLHAQNPFSHSQQLWGDAVYVKHLHQPEKLSDEQLLKAALVLHEVYMSYDVVQHLLAELDRRRSGSDLTTAYLQRLHLASGGAVVACP